MPLQNRVDPFGQIHAVAARGLFTGNRGVVHDPDTKTLLKRRWSTKAWIICDCGFQGRKRQVFGRNTLAGGAGWTNLFFLDDVTALAAGHRPCFECRRESAKAFTAAFAQGNGVVDIRAGDMDERLHVERLASGGTARRLSQGEAAKLPDGAMIAAGGATFAMRGGRALPWTFGGYGRPISPEALRDTLLLVTPPATVAALAAGYAPAWAPNLRVVT